MAMPTPAPPGWGEEHGFAGSQTCVHIQARPLTGGRIGRVTSFLGLSSEMGVTDSGVVRIQLNY